MNWFYYNHALLPTTAPHEEADVAALDNPETWKPKGDGHPLFARWTSNFDCGYDTGWYYCILDKPFDISALKSKYRYKINTGLRNFEVRIIDANDYAEQMYEVFIAAFREYSIAVHIPDRAVFCSNMKNSNMDIICWGAFVKGSNKLAAYAYVRSNGSCIMLPVLKANPEFEKLQVNAALVYEICEYFKEDLANGKYICDGQRNVYHPTNFQTYLEKYFGFRKAYCRLHLRYAPHIHMYIRILYPFRKILRYLPFNFVKKINAVLNMEEIVRNQKNSM
ncbi:MAG: hypothetical protein LBC49_03210 [Bacteroidales bacterium]|jgi:hypothetical protein|nr:hypothetical protein [Bacteroidales bacterium]